MKQAPLIKRSVNWRRLRYVAVLTVVGALIVPFPLTDTASAMAQEFIKVVSRSLRKKKRAQENPPSTRLPDRTEAQRIKISIGESRDFSFPVPMTSVLTVSPEIASVELKARSATIVGLAIGETILIAFDGEKRYTFVIQVIGKTYVNTRNNEQSRDVVVAETGFYGTYGISYAALLGSSTSVLRQNFDFRRKLTQGRTLRFTSDVFRYMGNGDEASAIVTAPGLGLNRLTLGVDSPSGSLDVLDSELNFSPASFNNFVMRGIHLVSTPNSRLRGMEFFAGLARPSLYLYDENQGLLAGVVMPLVQGPSFRVRAGAFFISPDKDKRLGNGGTVLRIDARYTPNKYIAADAEVMYANGGVSSRARLDVQRGPFTAYGEITHLDERSPLISIGAQSGGRESQAISLQWRASARLIASFNYNHTSLVPPPNSVRATFNRSTFSASANYRINQNSRVGIRFAQQRIETGTLASSSRFELETRTVSISHDFRFKKSWNNSFTARINSSREIRADASTDSGFNFNEQLRFTFQRGSATGFLNYTNQNLSLAGLLIRNPQLLPPVLQSIFAADPVGFLHTYRDTLSSLFPDIELPQTRGLDIGLRLQTAFSRINFAGELRYSSSEIFARDQKYVTASAGVNMRLDEANSLQFRGSRSFEIDSGSGRSAFTVSYIHRFGAGTEGGFQFTKFLGLDRGRIQGRVFFDINGNGQDDTDEPGIGGMNVQIDGNRTATTDANGKFRFQMTQGIYNVAVVSDDIGVRWRANTLTEQRVNVVAHDTVNVSFGLTNYGSIAGRIFNDTLQDGKQTAGAQPGIRGVRVTLRAMNRQNTNPSLTVDTSGSYQFHNLQPGSYSLEIDPASLPSDFIVPAQMSWMVTIEPLQIFYLDIPFSAQRAVSGVVYMDKDGSGSFDPAKDELVEGAYVESGSNVVRSGKNGAYILRGLPAGRIEIRIRSSSNVESHPIIIELSEEPTTRRGVNLVVRH